MAVSSAANEGGSAVAFVVVGHGLAASLLERQPGLGVFQRLDLALLVDRQHQRMLGRVEIEPHDRFQLVREVGSVAHLEAL